MARTGRPRIEIDYSQLEALCRIQCTLTEIAGFFGVSEDTIERRCAEHYKCTFAETFKRYSMPGKISLRRWQFRMAENNVAMAIFLGKNLLGQTDRQDVETHGTQVHKYVAEWGEIPEALRDGDD